jgi:hypothetical protein
MLWLRFGNCFYDQPPVWRQPWNLGTSTWETLLFSNDIAKASNHVRTIGRQVRPNCQIFWLKSVIIIIISYTTLTVEHRLPRISTTFGPAHPEVEVEVPAVFTRTSVHLLGGLPTERLMFKTVVYGNAIKVENREILQFWIALYTFFAYIYYLVLMTVLN